MTHEMNLNRDELIRYSRQIMLNNVGVKGQERLANTHVAIIGLGGLGCPAALYLTAAGIGKLTLIDHDAVELSNLQRQLLYTEADLGKSKAESAAQRLNQLNTNIDIQPVTAKADQNLLENLLDQVDIVLDCCDNFATRHAVNRACHVGQRALVSASAVRMEGQLAVFRFDRAQRPCYHCLFPEVAGELDTCSSTGILAPVVGILGAMQAQEALKIALNADDTSAQHSDLQTDNETRLQCYDARSVRWRSIKINPDPACPVCGS